VAGGAVCDGEQHHWAQTRLLARAGALYLHNGNVVCAGDVSGSPPPSAPEESRKIQEQLQFAFGVSPAPEERSVLQVLALLRVTLLQGERGRLGFFKRFFIRIYRVLSMLKAQKLAAIY
jgi:hypothetical protein